MYTGEFIVGSLSQEGNLERRWMRLCELIYLSEEDFQGKIWSGGSKTSIDEGHCGFSTGEERGLSD